MAGWPGDPEGYTTKLMVMQPKTEALGRNAYVGGVPPRIPDATPNTGCPSHAGAGTWMRRLRWTGSGYETVTLGMALLLLGMAVLLTFFLLLIEIGKATHIKRTCK